VFVSCLYSSGSADLYPVLFGMFRVI
jgi:hypothetical protein